MFNFLNMHVFYVEMKCFLLCCKCRSCAWITWTVHFYLYRFDSSLYLCVATKKHKQKPINRCKRQKNTWKYFVVVVVVSVRLFFRLSRRLRFSLCFVDIIICFSFFSSSFLFLSAFVYESLVYIIPILLINTPQTNDYRVSFFFDTCLFIMHRKRINSLINSDGWKTEQTQIDVQTERKRLGCFVFSLIFWFWFSLVWFLFCYHFFLFFVLLSQDAIYHYRSMCRRFYCKCLQSTIKTDDIQKENKMDYCS